MVRTLLWLMPKRTLTAMVGRLSHWRASAKLIPWYIRHYQIAASEADKDWTEYTSLAEFFSRRLKPGARPLDSQGVVSPVDGTVSEFDQIQSDSLLQAKGCSYSLSALLGSVDDSDAFIGGHYMTLYLSPKDYHRIHAPVGGRVIRWRFIPGRLYPVNRFGVASIPGLFTKNERMVTWVRTTTGTIALVKVGATIVGSIRTPFGPMPVRPFHRDRRRIRESACQIEVERGQEMGHFVFGSTVILLFPPGMIRRFQVLPGDFVRMGQSLASLSDQDG